MRALAEALHKRDSGIDISPGKITVGEYLERWLRDYADHNVGPSTLERYSGIINRHLVPALGALRLRDLRPAHVQAAYSDFLAGSSGRRGLSPRTVLHHHRVLREALKHAVQWQLVAQNPADAVHPPRPSRTEMRSLDAEETARLLDAGRDSPHHVLLYLAIATGARQGELLALRWADVDLDQGTLHIRRTARRFRGRGIVYSAPKSHRSSRPVALSADAVRVLREHRRSQVEQRLALGPEYGADDLVFATATGTPIDDSKLRSAFQRLAKEVGLSKVRFHDLRHTAATLMLKAGVNPKVISERLGHATVGFTLDTYSHVLPNMQREAAAALDDILRPRVSR